MRTGPYSKTKTQGNTLMEQLSVYTASCSDCSGMSAPQGSPFRTVKYLDKYLHFLRSLRTFPAC